MIKIIEDTLDFFLPRLCPSCNNKLSPDEIAVCSDCFSNIEIAEPSRIEYEYKRKFEEKNIISGFTSLYVFEKDKELQHVIHSLKYGQRFHNGIFMGKVLGLHIAEVIKDWKINIVVPIPLHSVKKAERGYNQSEYIAKGFCGALSFAIEASAVKRVKNTLSQTTMNIEEREDNMRNAFKVTKPGAIKDKAILLIDDVITTGATTSECGRELLEAGAAKVYATSVAIAD